MNKLTIIGNLTKDPELRKVNTSTGAVSVCDFHVAANGRKKEDTVFFRCTAWRGLGEMIAKYCSKGKKVCVIGSVTAHGYTGKDGKPAAILDVSVEDFEFCSPRGEAYDNDLKDGFTEVNDEDVPF